MTQADPDQNSPQWTQQDDTTRYLCAAAHLDPVFADNAIREFLVEPTRPVPPSPGLDAAAVLGEAVASRVRRKVRDAALLVLMALFVYVAWNDVLLYGWIGLALLLSVPAALGKRGAPKPVSGKAFALGAGLLVLLLVFSGLLTRLWNELESSSSSGSRSRYRDEAVLVESPPDETVWSVLAWVILLLTLGILLADRLVVWRLLTVHFGRGARTRPPLRFLNSDRPLLNLSPSRFLRQLTRHLDTAQEVPPGGAPLVVHRGYDPFVGAGRFRQAWSMVLPLEKLDEETKPDGSPFDELTTESLYERVRAEMAVLQSSTSLSPDRRLRGMRIIDAVYASAKELIGHLGEPATVHYLPDLDRPPNGALPEAEVTELRKQPREWSRYYLCFQVETWNRDLVMAMYLHAAVDESTLYLEWTPCVLPPIRPAYQAIDKLPPDSLRPVGQGVLDWLKLPATVPARILGVLSWLRPLTRERGVIDPDRYGSLSTLREMAAAAEYRNYFQVVDVDRYDKIMESRLVPAISQIMRDAGYSAAQFEQRALMVVNNDVNINGTSNAPIILGGTSSGPISGGTVGQAKPASGGKK
ncbi:hypothetical protein [Amycolatopsis anabasis]|uniref:hypothetical protein n=1 Tax=Amycolatopsis anabasis TaxID=1840409 RepID=UPI00131CDC33|nr:hypothetical protein [Amycolatopsis anabasis]